MSHIFWFTCWVRQSAMTTKNYLKITETRGRRRGKRRSFFRSLNRFPVIKYNQLRGLNNTKTSCHWFIFALISCILSAFLFYFLGFTLFFAVFSRKTDTTHKEMMTRFGCADKMDTFLRNRLKLRDKSIGGLGAAAWMGINIDSNPFSRWTFFIIDIGFPLS